MNNSSYDNSYVLDDIYKRLKPKYISIRNFFLTFVLDDQFDIFKKQNGIWNTQFIAKKLYISLQMIEHNMSTMAGINGFYLPRNIHSVVSYSVMFVTGVITCSMVRKNQVQAIISYGKHMGHTGKWQDRSVVTVQFLQFHCFLKDRVVVP